MGDVLLITRVASPFQLELTAALRQQACDAHVLFSTGQRGTRPKHWEQAWPEWAHLVDVDRRPHLLRGLFDRIAPRAVVFGGYRGLSLPAARALCRRRGVSLSLWLEPPLPGWGPKQLVRDLMIRRALADVDFLLCIGPIALEFYHRFARDRTRLHSLPYGQDLSKNLAWKREYNTETIKFLFSGKYLHRNNVWEMLAAFRSVRQEFGKRVEMILSGYAGMEAAIRAHVASDPILREGISHDTEFRSWEDRMRPFKQADVFVLPGLHAGWALVVPEAMSLGMPVIGSRGINAVRALIRDGHSGIVVEPTYEHIEEAMRRFVRSPELVGKMGRNGRSASHGVHSQRVAERLLELVDGPSRQQC